MKSILKRRVFLVLFVGLVLSPIAAFGQGEPFPNRPINLYVGYAAGGSGAITGQVLAEGLKKYLNQPVILNLKPGAAQAVAAEFMKNSKPDGYNLLYLSQANWAAKLAKDKKEGAPIKVQIADLDYLGAAPYSPTVGATSIDSPWKKIEDSIAAARKSPGVLNFCSDGIGTANHLLGEYFSLKAGITMSHIPFQGGGPATTAVLGGHVQLIFNSLATLGAQVKPGGGLRPLVIFDNKRTPILPDVPTALEIGYDIVMSTSYYGLTAPKGLPKPVRDNLIQAFEKTVKDLQMIAMFTKVNATLSYQTPEESGKRIQDEYNLFLDIWDKIGKK